MLIFLTLGFLNAAPQLYLKVTEPVSCRSTKQTNFCYTLYDVLACALQASITLRPSIPLAPSRLTATEPPHAAATVRRAFSDETEQRLPGAQFTTAVSATAAGAAGAVWCEVAVRCDDGVVRAGVHGPMEWPDFLEAVQRRLEAAGLLPSGCELVGLQGGGDDDAPRIGAVSDLRPGETLRAVLRAAQQAPHATPKPPSPESA